MPAINQPSEAALKAAKYICVELGAFNTDPQPYQGLINPERLVAERIQEAIEACVHDQYEQLVRGLHALLRSGQMCSNVCYNLAQKSYTIPDDAKSMRESYEAWDDASFPVRNLIPQN